MKKEQHIEAGAPTNGGGYSIIVDSKGPYFVYGNPELKQEFIVPNAQGEAWEYKDGITFKVEHEPMALCRCGHSRSKPFCDGTHSSADWDPALRNDRTPLLEEAMTYRGAALNLSDNVRFCVHARFCMAKGSVWELIEHTGEQEARDLSIRETFHCPSGRLKIKEKDKEDFLEPHLSPSLGLIEDPQQGCSGPLWVKGGIPMEDSECNPFEIRNRVTLCRCGSSQNKPYCDGRHLREGFRDGLPPLSAEQGIG